MRLYWITSEKTPQGYPNEKSVHEAVTQAGHELIHWVWDSEPLPSLSPSDRIILRTPWDYFEKLDAFRNFLETLPTSGTHNPREILIWNSDKNYLRALASQGIPVVPTRWVSGGSEESLRRVVKTAFPGREKVIKPVKSAAAYLTYRYTEDCLPSLTEFAGRDVMIQPFLPEIISEGERSLVYFGGQFSHAIWKRPKDGDFRVQESHGGRFSKFQPSELELLFGRNVLDSVEREFESVLRNSPLLYARVDYVRTAGRAHLMELELLEPDLYFHHEPAAADRFLRALEETC